jgi:hypothetical protein
MMSNRGSNRFVRLACVVTVVVGLTSFDATRSNAKLRPSEKPLLVQILAGSFGETPLKTTTTCVATRLSAGTMDEVIIDAGLVADVRELSDSISFRRLFKAIFACRPPQVSRVIVSGLSSSSLTFRQKSCFARGLMTRIGIDEEMLTLMIRGGLDDLNFDSLDADQQVVFERNARLAFRPCVAASAFDDYFQEVLNS